MLSLPELEVFTTRSTAKIGVFLNRPPSRRVRGLQPLYPVRVDLSPDEEDAVAKLFVRLVNDHCASGEQAKKSVIEIRVVAEGEGS